MRLLLLTGLIVLLSSCTYFRQYDLPFPESPQLVVLKTDIHDTPYWCFGYDDAAAIARYLDKLEAFKHAYERQR